MIYSHISQVWFILDLAHFQTPSGPDFKTHFLIYKKIERELSNLLVVTKSHLSPLLARKNPNTPEISAFFPSSFLCFSVPIVSILMKIISFFLIFLVDSFKIVLIYLPFHTNKLILTLVQFIWHLSQSFRASFRALFYPFVNFFSGSLFIQVSWLFLPIACATRLENHAGLSFSGWAIVWYQVGYTPCFVTRVFVFSPLYLIVHLSNHLHHIDLIKYYLYISTCTIQSFFTTLQIELQFLSSQNTVIFVLHLNDSRSPLITCILRTINNFLL